MAGFEPTTTTPPVWCATRLRYIPYLDYISGLMNYPIVIYNKEYSKGKK